MPEHWIKLIKRHGLKVMLNLTADKGSTVFFILKKLLSFLRSFFWLFSDLSAAQPCTHDLGHYHAILSGLMGSHRLTFPAQVPSQLSQIKEFKKTDDHFNWPASGRSNYQ